MRLATAVRERLAASRLFTLVYGTEQSSLTIHFVTQDPNDRASHQSQTGYSMVINLKFRDESFERYLTTFVGICGTSVVTGCADDIVANIDRYAERIRTSGSN